MVVQTNHQPLVKYIIDYVEIASTGNAVDFGDMEILQNHLVLVFQRSRRTLNITMESNI